MLLRLVVTTLLLGATIFFQLSQSTSFPAYPAMALYVLVGATFLLSFLYAIALPMFPDPWGFSFLQVMVDVVYYSALVYFTGGVSSAFSLIYIFPIIASGILHLRRGAILTASASSLIYGLLITLQFHGVIPASDWPWVIPWSSSSPGYVLWVMVIDFTVFFLAAFLSSSLAEQLKWTKDVLKLKETDYRKLSELHSSIVRSIPTGIITTDEEDRITFVNSAGTALLNRPLSELIGIRLSEVFPATGKDVADSGKRGDSFATVKEIDGVKRQMELSMSSLESENGALGGRLVVFQDVTLLRRMEDRVRMSEQQAALVRIGAGMAHEIRNPLAALRGAAELLSLESSKVSDEKKLLGIIIRESDRLNSLLSDFLLTVNPAPRNQVRLMFDDLVRRIVDQYSRDPRARDRVTLEPRIKKGIEVQGDAARLKQAVGNLLANAIEASPDGGKVHITLQSDRETNQAVLRVRDSGPGIPEQIRERIFEPFTTTKEGATGLGLSIVLSTVAAHKGSIDTESAEDKGTVFVMRLPLADGEPGAEGGLMHG
ncbi:MAG: PAS domain-containing protein [Desulfomonile sp.]|nr:PAS domain-containing protein [Desulfomonile sp.]